MQPTTRVMSKIIPKEDMEGIENWSLPEVSVAGRREPSARPLTARQIEDLQQQAREEAFQQGRQEGLEAGKKEIRARVRELESLMQTLARPLEQLDARARGPEPAGPRRGRHAISRTCENVARKCTEPCPVSVRNSV